MDPRYARAVEVGRAIVRDARAENVTSMAGSMAYHAFVSLLPLLLFVLTVLATVGSSGIGAAVLAVVQAVLTQDASAALVAPLRQAGSATSLSVLGGLVLLWGTLRIFRGLDTAFSDIYETEAENTFADQLADGLLVLLALTVAVLGAVAVQTRVPLHGAGPLVSVDSGPFTVVGLAVALFPMYYVFPDTDVSVVEVLPGVLLAATTPPSERRKSPRPSIGLRTARDRSPNKVRRSRTARPRAPKPSVTSVNAWKPKTRRRPISKLNSTGSPFVLTGPLPPPKPRERRTSSPNRTDGHDDTRVDDFPPL